MVASISVPKLKKWLLQHYPFCAWCDHHLNAHHTIDNHVTVDHLTPRAIGGETKLDNLVLSCRTCNEAKGSQPFSFWLTEERRFAFLKYLDGVSEIDVTKDTPQPLEGYYLALTQCSVDERCLKAEKERFRAEAVFFDEVRAINEIVGLVEDTKLQIDWKNLRFTAGWRLFFDETLFDLLLIHRPYMSDGDADATLHYMLFKPNELDCRSSQFAYVIGNEKYRSLDRIFWLQEEIRHAIR